MNSPCCTGHWINHRHAAAFLCAAIVSTCGTFSHAQAPPAQAIEYGPIRIEYRPRPAGMRLLYDGIEIVKSSDLVVTKPPWAPHHYVGPTIEAVARAKITGDNARKTLAIHHVGTHDSFRGEERMTIAPDGVVEHTLVGAFLREDEKALIQWRAGALNPSVIIGKPYKSWSTDGTTHHGFIPVIGIEEGQTGGVYLKGLKILQIDSRIGPIRIEIESNQSITFQDYRTSRWANPTNPYFWFGDLSSQFDDSNPVSYRFRYIFQEKKGTYARTDDPTIDVAIAPTDDAQIAFSDEDPIITPTPKAVEFHDGWVSIAAPGAVNEGMLNANAPATSDKAVQLLFDAWRSIHDANNATFTASAGSDENPAPNIAFQIASDNVALPPEGYRVSVQPDLIDIEAKDEPGFLHAVQTLKQLSRVDRQGRLAIKSCSIQDWPSLSFRGAHFFTGGGGTNIHEMLIDKIVAGLKMNKLVFEAEYIEWDSHPELHHETNGMPKSEVRKLLGLCKKRGVEVIPLVQALGHCQWIFETGHHLDIAEDPEAKWAYCVTNPKSYAFIFEIYKEAVELFKPRVFHIGHDEYTDRGRVPFREESKKYTVEQLFVMDTLKLHAWFKEQDIRILMWGDMMLAEGEGPDACHAKSLESARKMRRELPSDIIITDWHYADDKPAAFVNLNVFHHDGFETIASTWNRPGNIVNFARAAYDSKSLGLLQTTWAGYSLDNDSFNREMPQYLAYVIAAEAAWNADRPVTLDMLDAGQRFFDLCGTSSLSPGWRSGWTTDLRAACNFSLDATDQRSWFGLGPQHDLSNVPRGIVRHKGLLFDIPDSRTKSCIALQGRLSRGLGLPSKTVLNVKRIAEELAFLIATDFACAQGTKVGTIDVTFENGASETLDLIYGENLFAHADPTPSPNAPVIWRGNSTGGTAIALRVLLWKMPAGSRNIKRVTIQSAHAPASIVLLGLTGLSSASGGS